MQTARNYFGRLNLKYLISGLVVVMLIIGLAVATILVKRNQDLREKAAVQNGTTVLSLIAQNAQMQPGQTFTVDVNVNDTGKSVDGFQFSLTSSVPLSNLAFTPANINGLVTVVNETPASNKINFAIITSNPLSPYVLNGTVKLGELSFTAPASSVTISQDNNLSIVAQNQTAQDILLKNTTGFAFQAASSATPTATASPTSTPTATPTTSSSPTATPAGSVTLKVKLQGATGGQSKKIDVGIKTGSSTSTIEDVVFTSIGNSVYQGSFSVTGSQTSVQYLKGEGYLKVVNGNPINLSAGSTVDISLKNSLAGDFDGNNKINILDIAQLLSAYTQLSTTVNNLNEKYDVTADGKLDILDIATVLANYTQLEVLGE